MSDSPRNVSAEGGQGSTPEMDRRSRAERRRAERRQVDERVREDRRRGEDRRQGPRRRSRSINQYDMEADVLEFVNAINRFKARSGRAFPTWSEVLTILRDLGYEKRV